MFKLNCLNGHPIPDQDARERLYKMKEHRMLTDMALSSEKRIYPCHRVLLAHVSPYVEALMKMQRTGDPKLLVVAVGDFLDLHLQLFLEYIYLGTLLVDPKDFNFLRKLANKLTVTLHVDKFYDPMKMNLQLTTDLLTRQDDRKGVHKITKEEKTKLPWDGLTIKAQSTVEERKGLPLTKMGTVAFKTVKNVSIKTATVVPVKSGKILKPEEQQEEHMDLDKVLQKISDVEPVEDKTQKLHPNPREHQKKKVVEKVTNIRQVEMYIDYDVVQIQNSTEPTQMTAKHKKPRKNDLKTKAAAVHKNITVRSVDPYNQVQLKLQDVLPQLKEFVPQKTTTNKCKRTKVHAVDLALSESYISLTSDLQTGEVFKGVQNDLQIIDYQSKVAVPGNRGVIEDQQQDKMQVNKRRKVVPRRLIEEDQAPIILLKKQKKKKAKSGNPAGEVSDSDNLNDHEDDIILLDLKPKKKRVPRKPKPKKTNELVPEKDSIDMLKSNGHKHNASNIAFPIEIAPNLVESRIKSKSSQAVVKKAKLIKKRAVVPMQDTSYDDCWKSTKIVARAKKRKVPVQPTDLGFSKNEIEREKVDIYELDPSQEGVATIRPKRLAYFTARKRMADIANGNQNISRCPVPLPSRRL